MIDKIRLVKSLDAALGKVLVKLLAGRVSGGSDAGRIDSGGAARILVIRPGGIGDAVLLIPALRALKKLHPGARLDVLCEKRNAGVFDLLGIDGSVYLYDSPGGLFRCLSNRYDIVVDTEQWHRLSAVAAYLTGAPVRAGFATNERAALFTHTAGYDHDDYEVESFFNLIRPLAPQGFSTSPQKLFSPPEKLFSPENIFSFDPDAPFIELEADAGGLDGDGAGLAAVFPGASVRQRRWGADKFGAVAAALDGLGYGVIIVGSRADSSEAAGIMRIAPHAVDLTGRTTLTECARALKSCRVLVTADSGLMHIALAVGTPTVSLFGSGIEKKWAPRGARHRVINRRLSCSPCTRFGYTPECNAGLKCLSEITAEEVVDALGSLF